jgi:hypothetical protein
MGSICGSKAVSGSSAYWIDSGDRFADRIKDVVADHAPTMTNENDPMKIVQAEEAREEKSIPPKRIGNPGVQIIIIPRWRIVCDYRRAFLVIIVVYYRRVKLGLFFSVLA